MIFHLTIVLIVAFFQHYVFVSGEILLCLTEQVFQAVCPILVALYAVVYSVHISPAFNGLKQFDEVSETLFRIIGYEYVGTFVPRFEG